MSREFRFPSKPLLGELIHDPTRLWKCAVAGKPGQPWCGADATWHGLVLPSQERDHLSGVTACDRHLPIMKLTSDYEHPLVHPCALPGARFDEHNNLCVLTWDEQSLLGALSSEGSL